MRGHREPLSVPERPDIGIAAIPLLAIRCGVAGARVNDSDIAMRHQMDLVAVEPSQRFNVASRRCAGLRGPFRRALLPYENGSEEPPTLLRQWAACPGRKTRVHSSSRKANTPETL